MPRLRNSDLPETRSFAARPVRLFVSRLSWLVVLFALGLIAANWLAVTPRDAS